MSNTNNLKIIILNTYHQNDSVVIKVKLINESKNEKIKNPISDALTMSRQAWPNLPSYKLTDLAKMGNLDTSGAHRALEDCKMTMTVYGAASTLLKRA